MTIYSIVFNMDDGSEGSDGIGGSDKVLAMLCWYRVLLKGMKKDIASN
jgi:hypothetical protein